MINQKVRKWNVIYVKNNGIPYLFRDWSMKSLNLIYDSRVKTCLHLKVGDLWQVLGIVCDIKVHFDTERVESVREQKERLYLTSRNYRLFWSSRYWYIFEISTLGKN